MTPLEKASQMIVDYQLTFKSLSYEEAVQCSIRTVDDILQELELVCVDEMVQFSNRWKYWEEVKELLQKQSNKHHIVDTNEMVDQVPDVRKMVDDDKESFLLWVRSNYERCKTGWIDLETGNKHRIEADLVYEYNQLHSTSSQTEISDEEIESNAVLKYKGDNITQQRNNTAKILAFEEGAKWYREQLKKKI